MINSFNFDDYPQLEKVCLTLVIGSDDAEDVEDTNVCDFEGVSFGSCKFISISVQRELNYFFQGTWILKNLNVIPDLISLDLNNFSSIINVNAPNIKFISINLDFKKRIQFRNIYSPDLLNISTSGQAKDNITTQELRNIYAPNLEYVNIDESTLEEGTSIVCQNLQSIKTKNFHSWIGKFNPSILSQLTLYLGEKNGSGEDYASLKKTKFPSLDFLSIKFGKAPPCCILEVPFADFYPNLSWLSLFSEVPIPSFQGSSLSRLSKFPKLKTLDLELCDPTIKINGLCIDSLTSLSFRIKENIESFELTESSFKNLKHIDIEGQIASSTSTIGKIDIVSPSLESFRTSLNMVSINFLNFQTNNLQHVYLRGPVFEIELGDIKNLSSLRVAHPFGKLSYRNEPAEFFRELELRKPFPVVSLEGIKKLYSFSNERKGIDGLPAITW